MGNETSGSGFLPALETEFICEVNKSLLDPTLAFPYKVMNYSHTAHSFKKQRIPGKHMQLKKNTTLLFIKRKETTLLQNSTTTKHNIETFKLRFRGRNTRKEVK